MKPATFAHLAATLARAGGHEVRATPHRTTILTPRGVSAFLRAELIQDGFEAVNVVVGLYDTVRAWTHPACDAGPEPLPRVECVCVRCLSCGSDIHVEPDCHADRVLCEECGQWRTLHREPAPAAIIAELDAATAEVRALLERVEDQADRAHEVA